jgi:hypothetical protein
VPEFFYLSERMGGVHELPLLAVSELIRLTGAISRLEKSFKS